jgi:hypothetical protein
MKIKQHYFRNHDLSWIVPGIWISRWAEYFKIGGNIEIVIVHCEHKLKYYLKGL